MIRYFYAWMPITSVVGLAVLLSIPYLALLALLAASLVAVAALGWVIVAVPHMLSRAASRSWQARSHASPRQAAPLSRAGRQSA